MQQPALPCPADLPLLVSAVCPDRREGRTYGLASPTLCGRGSPCTPLDTKEEKRKPGQGREAAPAGWRGPQPVRARTRARRGEPLTRMERQSLCEWGQGRRAKPATPAPRASRRRVAPLAQQGKGRGGWGIKNAQEGP
ncbi:hypothetical protein EVJ02_24690 [Salmonella enterica subsp. enterica serovar Kedougou]|nr:hypothetical protein [Salmonella enterica subsp. enterica serovar Kedougou]EBZ1846983.1 hypothetical protein [Salmonella enterica subsp. enterica serovar Kedougou]ECG1938171.1 hypothetical protein [Salmonella enterica subsp. enterica serovar Kedougou]ECG2576795.1 hypothetical protein [Salmonella enterica subsp. enterica serovar Kedougou]